MLDRELSEAGADINAKDKQGKTALTYATENGYLEIIGMIKTKLYDSPR